MKKNFLAILAVVAGLGLSAFTSERPPVVKKGTTMTSFYWFDPITKAYVGRQNTKLNEKAPSGCPDVGTVHCEDGYLDQDLLVSGDPEAGLKSNAIIRDFLVQP